MSDAAQGTDGAGRGTGAVGGSQFAVLLACFSGTKAADKARRGLDAQLRSQGDAPNRNNQFSARDGRSWMPPAENRPA